MKKTNIEFSSMALAILENEKEANYAIETELTELDYRFLRTLALKDIIDKGNIPFQIDKANFDKTVTTIEFNTEPYDATVDCAARFFDVSLELSRSQGNFHEVLFSASQYIAMKLWPGTEYMCGVLGVLYYKEARLFRNPEIKIYSPDLARVYFSLGNSNSVDISEQFPLIGQLYSQINQVQKQLINSFRNL